MQISPIQQDRNYRNNNFKGTVSPEVTSLINKCAKVEAKHYITSLERGVSAEEKVLLNIKKTWNLVLTTISEKVQSMHPSTNLRVKEYKDIWRGKVYDLFFENKPLDIGIHNHFIKASEIECGLADSKRFIKISNEIEPKKIDKAILERAINKLEGELQNDNLSTYSTKYPAIIEYQGQSKNITKEETKSNVVRMNKAINKAKAKRAEKIKIENVKLDNQELLNKIFG
jgi:hypothetical protein